MDVSEEWKSIETAPKDGSLVEVCQIKGGEISFQRNAVWRTVTFPSFINGRHGVEPEHVETGWMYPDIDKRVPSPTHWRS